MITEKSSIEFISQLASKAPVPGGGGASALVGGIGTALGNMVGSLTVGKKKYASVEGDILLLKEKADKLQADFLRLVEMDAVAFEPLAKAYGLPRNTDAEKAYKAEVMEKALKEAAAVPLDIIKACGEALLLMVEFEAKGSVIAISDVGVGVAFLKAALMGASLNVFINTKLMQDRGCAEDINQQTNDLLATYTEMADQIYSRVLQRLI